jgi:hypothetical protein
MEGHHSQLPLLVSFPRCGGHWIVCALEHYLGQPRAFYTDQGAFPCRISLLDDGVRGRTPAFLHAHDVALRIRHDPRKTIYLYRDPAAVLFSLLRVARVRNPTALDKISSDRYVSYHAVQYKRHLENYLLSAARSATVLRYESVRKDATAEFRRICVHIGVEFDESRAAGSCRAVTKAKLAQSAAGTLPEYFNQEMTSVEYGEERSAFTEQYRHLIEKLVITEELKPFFEPLE